MNLRLRLMLAGSLLLSVFCALAPGAESETREPGAGSTQSFPIGVWDNVPVNRFGEVAKAGFNIVVSGAPGRLALSQAILDSAGAHNVKIILRNTWHEYFCSPRAGTDSSEVILAKFAEDDKNFSRYPALYAWFLRNEPGESEIDKISNVNKLARKFDPLRPRLISLYPISITSLTNAPVKNYREYVRTFVDNVGPDVICFSGNPFLKAGAALDLLEENLSVIRNESVRAGIPFWYVTQCSGWQKNVGQAPRQEWVDVLRVPNETEIRTAVGLALVYGAKGIFYFRYTPCKDGVVRFTGLVDSRETDTQSLTLTDHGYFPDKNAFFNVPQDRLWPNTTYFQVKSINTWIRKLSSTLLEMDSSSIMKLTATNQPVSGPGGLTSPAPDVPSETVDTRTSGSMLGKIQEGSVTIGQFTGGGKLVVGIVNRETEKRSVVTVAFKGKSGSLLDVVSGKKLSLAKGSNKEFPLYTTLTLDPGQTLFLRANISSK